MSDEPVTGSSPVEGVEESAEFEELIYEFSIEDDDDDEIFVVVGDLVERVVDFESPEDKAKAKAEAATQALVRSAPAGPPAPDSEEEIARKNALREFGLEFIKLLTTTAIYRSDHPLAQQMGARPFELLQALDLTQGELSFVIDQDSLTPEDEDLSIEGVLAQPVKVERLLRSSMSEHFADKLKTYFNRNRVLNLSIKAAIDRDEFTRFITVMVEHDPDAHKLEAHALERRFEFTQALIDHEVPNVSVLLWDDLIGQERRLPWRVKIAVARLRKDLRNLPLYQDASGRELYQAKRLIVVDIIRPLARPDFLKDLLLNADLISQGVEDVDDFDVEQVVVDCLPPGLVGPLVWEMVRDIDWIRSTEFKDEDKEAAAKRDAKIVQMLKVLATRLQEDDDYQAYATLRELFDRKVLEWVELPVRLQRLVKREAWSDKFIEDPTRHVRGFLKATDAKVLQAYFERFVLVIPELLQRRRVAEAIALLGVVKKRSKEPAFRSVLVKFRDQLYGGDLLDQMFDAIRKAPKKKRKPLFGVLQVYKDQAPPVLVRLLSEADDAALRREVCEVLTRFGPRAVPLIIGELGLFAHKWTMARNLLLVLGNIGDRSAAPEVLRYLTHPHERVREQALVAATELRGAAAEPYLTERLSDTSSGVRRRAMRRLAMIGSRHERFLTEIERVLMAKPIEGEGMAAMEELRHTAVHCINALGNVRFPSGVDARLRLEEVVGAGRGLRAVRELIMPSAKRLSIGIRVQACKVLGEIGDEKTVQALGRVASRAEPALSEAAKDAIRRIDFHRRRREKERADQGSDDPPKPT
jgi:HEAT repeat protein